MRQRVIGPQSYAEIKLDITQMADGDVAGLAVHQQEYNYIGVTYDETCHKKTIVINDNGIKEVEVLLPEETVEIWLRVEMCNMEYCTRFSYSLDGVCYIRILGHYEMHYGCYVGIGFGVFNYAEKSLGGYVDESSYQHNLTTRWTADCVYTDLMTKWGSACDLAVTNLKDGDWLQYNQMDFGIGADWFHARVSGTSKGGILEVHDGSIEGRLLAILEIPDTKEGKQFANVFAEMKLQITGMQIIFLVYRGPKDVCSINWFMFGRGELPTKL